MNTDNHQDNEQIDETQESKGEVTGFWQKNKKLITRSGGFLAAAGLVYVAANSCSFDFHTADGGNITPEGKIPVVVKARRGLVTVHPGAPQKLPYKGRLLSLNFDK